MALTPKQRISLAVKILTGELDETDLPDVLAIQHQRPPKLHIRPADMKNNEKWFDYQDRCAKVSKKRQNQQDRKDDYGIHR